MTKTLWLAGGLAWLALSCLAEEAALSKRISVDYRNAPLADVLKDLEAKTGARIAAAEALLQNQDNVTRSATDQEAGRVLTRILRPRGLNIETKGGGSVSVVKLPDLEEFRVKSEQVFEFREKPKVTREGDKVTIAFETKAFCDVTVALEDDRGEIVRHLASGALGDNAPEPFQWNSKKQTLLWDGKNDKGEYVDDKDSVTVRVSLGLKPAYERPLFWSPHKRRGPYAPILCAAPEGVYVCEGQAVDSVQLFDHDGNYVRTIYPFPAGKLDQVVGLEKQTVLQTGQSLPRKSGYHLSTLLTSGNSSRPDSPGVGFGDSRAATAMAVQDDRMALAFLNLNRLRTDGSSGGLPLKGPVTGFVVPKGTLMHQEGDLELGPTSAALSPDGKTLYLTGYVYQGWTPYARQGVYKIAYEKDQPAEVFAGNMDPTGYGDDNSHFAVPNSVACDGKGRVYVADFLNNRVQVYAPDGKHLKTLPAPMPAKVQIDPRTQDLYVFSWFISKGMCNDLVRKYKVPDWETLNKSKYKPTLTRFGPFDDPKPLGQWELPLQALNIGYNVAFCGQTVHIEMDFWGQQPTLWIVGRRSEVSVTQIGHSGLATIANAGGDDAGNTGVCLFVQKGEKWELHRNFTEDARKAVARIKPPDFGIQRLFANEKNHRLYLLEHVSFNKSNETLIEIDPQTGKSRTVPMPFRAEDICFDRDGHIYLRTDSEVARYDPATWREVPWDYGEQRSNVAFSSGRSATVNSALPIPGSRPIWWHQPGMWVSPKGHLAVACVDERGVGAQTAIGPEAAWQRPVAENPQKYQPTLYPGRAIFHDIHIFDQHGKMVRDDAVPGIGFMSNGLGIDKDDNLYVMAQSPRFLGGQAHPNPQAGTVVKFRARGTEVGEVKILTPGASRGIPVPLPADQTPKRPPDIAGSAWMTGAEWFYGGSGIVGNGCVCYHTRFQIDTFARSFAPEPDLYSVAVLDSNGNLIVRVGKYGNADDGIPLVNAELGRRNAEGEARNQEDKSRSASIPSSEFRVPRSIGGDEVPLFYPAYVGVDTDRRLFISDIGNARIVSVKLGYHAEEKVALKNVTDQKK